MCARVCVRVDCSQLLNINLKVKGRELFDIHAGSVPCTGCWSPTHAAAPIRSLWVIMSATVSPFLPLMCCHNIEPDCLRFTDTQHMRLFKGASWDVALKIHYTTFGMSRFCAAVWNVQTNVCCFSLSLSQVVSVTSKSLIHYVAQNFWYHLLSGKKGKQINKDWLKEEERAQRKSNNSCSTKGSTLISPVFCMTLLLDIWFYFFTDPSLTILFRQRDLVSVWTSKQQHHSHIGVIILSST